jgi:hypothetical protein
MRNLTPINLPSTSRTERVQTHTPIPIQKSSEIQVQVSLESVFQQGED